MSNSAKTVLWIGLFMILAGIIKNWSTFSSTLFGGSSSYQYQNPPNGVQHLPVPSSGVCPKGYTKVGSQCAWIQPVAPNANVM